MQLLIQTNTKMIMRRIIILLAAALIAPIVATAQDDIYLDSDSVELKVVETAPIVKESKKERKEREKRQRQRVDSLAHVKSMGAIMRDYYVLLADEVGVGNMGYMEYGVQRSTNFIVVQGDKAMVQFAFHNGSFGANGLGGLTVSGRVTNKQVSQDKKGNVWITFHIIGSRVNADVNIEMYANCDYANAQVNATLGRERLQMNGRLVPYKNDDLHFDP